METATNYSMIEVQVPFHYQTEHPGEMLELRERFPRVRIKSGGVDHVALHCDRFSNAAREVFEWTFDHLSLN